ncbi:MAG: PKD domain-containing protein [Flavobacteriales bacterium]
MNNKLLSTLLAVIAYAVTASGVFGQNSCPNTGFEDGDFTNWTGGTGSCCPINVTGVNIIDGRHTIMTGPGTDPNTDGAITVVAPGGGGFSARLGNDQSGNQAERLTYSMTVDANNQLFIYRYAVVLEDPSHSPSEQPRFDITMFDENGALINCGVYSVTSAAGIPGFVTLQNQFFTTVNYKDWTAVGMDLSAYVGQTVTIQFATGDCDLGGHYGYAYIDCYCSSLALTSDFCPGLPTAVLEAPLGFATYQWSDLNGIIPGETAAALTIDAPATGQTYSCELTSVTGCTVTLSSTLTPTVLAAGLSQVGNCQNDVQFTDNSVVVSGPAISNWLWDFGDGTTSTDQNPFHSFDTPGDHDISLSVYSNGDCPDVATATISLIPSPQVGFTVTEACEGLPTQFNDTTELLAGLVERRWDFGDGPPGSSDVSPTHVYTPDGSYDVSLFIEFDNGCMDSVTVQVNIADVPVVDLGPDQTVCEGVGVNLNAGNPGLTYLWSTGAVTQTIQPTTTGDYWVEVENAGLCAGVDTVYVQFDPLPVLQLQDSTTCIANSVTLDAMNPGATYSWNTGENTQTLTVSQNSGIHTVTVTSPEGCSIQESASVFFAPLVSVELGTVDAPCYGEVVTLDAGTFPNAQYLWSTSSTDQAIDVVDDAMIYLEISNGYCTATDSVEVIFDPLPQIQLNDSILCIENTLVLDATNPACTYLWSTGETTPTITVGVNSEVFSVVVTAPNGCNNSDQADITFIPSIILDLGLDSVLCDMDTILFDATNPNGSYLWSDGSTNAGISITESTDLSVFVTNGYCTAVDTVILQFIPNPAHVEVTLIDTCFEDPRVVVTLEGSVSGTLYDWSTGESTQDIQVTDFGEYVVMATNLPRCATVDTIVVREYCPPRVFVPNAFTPDNDGFNENFFPIGYNIRTVQFMIFDRWGERIFRSVEDGNGWDGRVGGKLAKTEVYNWRYDYVPILDANGTTGAVETIQGVVTLLR